MDKFKEYLPDFGLLWLRVLMGVGIAYHGYGKVFGGKIDRFAEGIASMGFPAPEIFAWAALFVFVTMAVAAFIKHGADPLKRKELALAYWTISGALIFLGSGRFSLDYLIRNHCKK